MHVCIYSVLSMCCGRGKGVRKRAARSWLVSQYREVSKGEAETGCAFKAAVCC